MIFARQLLTGTRKCIVAMEGHGPLHGTARDLRRIVRSDDPVAADFTCARLMGFDPYRISHLAQAARERLPRTVRPFSVLPDVWRQLLFPVVLPHEKMLPD